MTNEQLLTQVLEELIEQIDCLDDISFSRDTEPYKAEACWDYALTRARVLVRKMRQQEAA